MVRFLCRCCCPPSRWEQHRPDAISKPSGGNTEGFCDALDGINARLAAVFDLGKAWGFQLDHASQCRFGKSPLDADGLQALTHAIAACAWIWCRVPKSIREPRRRNPNSGSKLRDGADTWDAVARLDVGRDASMKTDLRAKCRRSDLALLPCPTKAERKSDEKRIGRAANHRRVVARAERGTKFEQVYNVTGRFNFV